MSAKTQRAKLSNFLSAAQIKEFELLLKTGKRATQAGNQAGAQALFRFLTRQYPTEGSAWLALAEVTTDEVEREEALAYAQKLESPSQPLKPSFYSLTLRFISWFGPLIALLSLGILLWMQFTNVADQQSAIKRREQMLVELPQTPILPSPTARPRPQPLDLGSVVTFDNWQVTLNRPEYAMVISQTVGYLPPQGQWVLVLPAIGNTATVSRPLPLELFALSDAQGRWYQPHLKASANYLAVYGRGKRGDFALGEALPSGGGMFSVPILFDLPSDASGLLLAVGQAPEGLALPGAAGSARAP